MKWALVRFAEEAKISGDRADKGDTAISIHLECYLGQQRRYFRFGFVFHF
jgi:hypothetical protein